MAENETVTPDSTPTPTTPDTSQAQANEGNTERLLSQAEVDRIIGDRVKRATESARAKVLEELGLASVDEAKKTIEAERQRKEAEMSAVEKIQAQLDAQTKALEAEKQRASELETARRNDKRDNGLLQLLGKAHDANMVLTLLKAKYANELETLIADDGTFDSKTAETLINTFEGANAYLFKSGSPGSPSNSGGRVPQPDLKEAEQAVFKRFGKL
jgi:hypothetical protein